MPGILLGTGNSNEQGRCGPCLNRGFILVEKTDNKQLNSDLKTVTINAKMMKSTVLVEQNTGPDWVWVILLFDAPKNKWVAQSYSTTKRRKNQNLILLLRHSVIFGPNLELCLIFGPITLFSLIGRASWNLDEPTYSPKIFESIQNSSITDAGSAEPSLFGKVDAISLIFTRIAN